MAQAQTKRFSEFLIELESLTVPGTYEAPCGLNTKSFNRTAATNETNVPNCPEDDEPSWLERDVVSNSAAISGAGVVADEDFDTWDQWYTDGVTRSCRVTLGSRIWTGGYKLTGLNMTGTRGSRVTFDASMLSDGEIART